MTYPVVEASATSVDSDRSGTTLSMNLPTGIVNKDVLYGVVTLDATGDGNVTWPAGWNEFIDVDDGSNAVATSHAWKLADGTESGTISVTVASTDVCGIIYRIGGAADPNHEPPLSATRQRSTTATSYFGRQVFPTHLETNDYLAFVTAHRGESTSVIDAYPDNYSNTANLQSTGSSGDCQMWYGHRDVRAPAEYSGSWIFDSGVAGINTVVMFYPKVRWNNSTTYPYVRSAARTNDSGRSASTTFNMKLPQTVHTGDILLAFITQDDVTSPAITWPNGWTELYDDHTTNAVPGPNSSVTGAAAWRKANGQEDSTVPLTCAADRICSVVISIGGSADPETSPPETQVDTGSVNSDFEPPTVTPSGGSDDYLWIICHHINDEDRWMHTFSANFEARVRADSNVSPSAGCDTVVCWRQYTGSTLSPTQDPGLTTVGGTESVTSHTAITPGNFSNGQWWYQGRYDSGRGRFM